MSSDVHMDKSDIGRPGGRASNTTALLDAGADVFRNAVQRASAWTEAARRYVRGRRAAGIAADIAQLARERPGQTLAAAALMGALVGGTLYRLGRR
jgi:hypothetical protein